MNTLAAHPDSELGHQALIHTDEPLIPNILSRFQSAANDALFSVKELIIDTEMSIEEIAQYFEVHHFGLQVSVTSFKNCKIVLTSDEHLEIYHYHATYPARFRVFKKLMEQ